jgi:hypothetical protein
MPLIFACKSSSTSTSTITHSPATSVRTRQWSLFAESTFGPTCAHSSKTMSTCAQHVSAPKHCATSLTGSYNHSLFPLYLGILFRWISSNIYHFLLGLMLFLPLLID